MTTTSPNDEHQLQYKHQQLKQEGYNINPEQPTIATGQWKQHEHDAFYTMKKQSVAAVLSPLSSNASSPPTEPFSQSTENTQSLSLLPFMPLLSSSPPPSLPKAIQVVNNESMPSPPPSASTKGMDKSLNSRKQKSPSPYAGTTTTNMTRDQIRYCGALIRNLKKHRDATPFIHPVDYVKLNLPDYPQIIKTPMDLTTIDRKFQHKEYSDVNQLINDIRLLFNNCYKFNGPEAMVSVLCQNVESAFEKSLRQMPLSKKVTNPSSVSSSHESSPLQAISPIFRRRSDAIRPIPTPPPRKDNSNPLTTNAEATNPSQGRRRRRRSSRDNTNGLSMIKRRKTDAQLKFCGQAIRELKKNKYLTINYPFLYPVDAVALNIPDYHSIITHPMDISTIERNLTNGAYNSAEDVESDVRLMFNNCYRYNPPTLPIHKMAKELEMVFDEKWKQLPKPEPTPPPPTPPPSHSSVAARKNDRSFHDGNGDDSDDDDGDVSDGDDRIAELERHIASIAQQIESIKSTKKKSSSTPATGTKRKTPSAKKKTRHPSSAPKEKSTPIKPRRHTSPTPKQQHRRRHSPSSSSTPAELPEFTFDQKKELSERINNLTGDRLNTVVNIIQSSMPNLNGQGQDEIVLDIDVLDRKTLHQLYEFITGTSLRRKQHQHQSKKRKTMDKDQRLRALEESMRQINAGTHASSQSDSSESESEDDFWSE